MMRDLGTMTHMGGVGTGQATKLVNQTLVLTNYCVLAEALRLAQAYGVDARQNSAGARAGPCGIQPAQRALPAHDRRGFYAARFCAAGAERSGDAARRRPRKTSPMPMASQALTLYRLLVAAGKSDSTRPRW